MREYPGFGRGKVESREESYRRWKNGKSGLSLPAATVIRELQGGTKPRVFRGRGVAHLLSDLRELITAATSHILGSTRSGH